MKYTPLTLLLLLCMTACSEKNQPQTETGLKLTNTVPQAASLNHSTTTQTPIFQPAFITAGLKSLTRLHHDIEQLHNSVQLFMSNDSVENWTAIQSSWQNAHNQWHSSSFFLSAVQRFSNPGFPLTKILDAMHSAPITAGYLDSVEGYPFSGLVNDITVPITASAIREQHQRFDVDEIALGLHVVEFFLWQKTPADFLTSGPAKPEPERSISGDPQSSISAAQRRGKMLLLVTRLLNEDSQQLLKLWPATTELYDQEQHPQQSNPILAAAVNQLLAMTKHSAAETSAVDENLYLWQQRICVDLQQQLENFIANEISAEQMTDVNNHLKNIRQNLDNLMMSNAEKNQAENEQQLVALRKNRGLLIQTLNGIIIEQAKL